MPQRPVGMTGIQEGLWLLLSAPGLQLPKTKTGTRAHGPHMAAGIAFPSTLKAFLSSYL